MSSKSAIDFLLLPCCKKGGPDWIDSERFNVEAKAANEFPAGLDSPSAPRRMMLQALLADRFKLRVHHETQEGNIYALTFAKRR